MVRGVRVGRGILGAYHGSLLLSLIRHEHLDIIRALWDQCPPGQHLPQTITADTYTLNSKNLYSAPSAPSRSNIHAKPPSKSRTSSESRRKRGQMPAFHPVAPHAHTQLPVPKTPVVERWATILVRKRGGD